MAPSVAPLRVVILTADVFEDLRRAGAIYEDSAVVVDGNLVTSRWPQDLPDFMREVMAMLHP